MTIAQQLKIKEFPFEINDSNGNLIYFEDSNGYWEKRQYDTNGKLIYHEDSTQYWEKRKYDTSGELIYYKNFTGYWTKREYDASGNVIYFEDSNGVIQDNRPKTEVQKAIELLTKAGLLVDGKIINKL